jgi:hypothetical protein
MTAPTPLESAYTTQHAAALAQLQAIQSIIESKPEPGVGKLHCGHVGSLTRINDKLHWGHVGSLTRINEQLGEILRFATGQ